MAGDGRDMPGDDLFDRLYDALSDETLDAEALRTSLKANGLKADKIAQRGQQLFSTFLHQQQLARARARLDYVRSLLARIKHSPQLSVDDLRDQLSRILAGADAGDAYFAYYRKLENVDPDDLASLPNDAAVMDLIARLDEQDPIS